MINTKQWLEKNMISTAPKKKKNRKKKIYKTSKELFKALQTLNTLGDERSIKRRNGFKTTKYG